jgi:hypothetical protein
MASKVTSDHSTVLPRRSLTSPRAIRGATEPATRAASGTRTSTNGSRIGLNAPWSDSEPRNVGSRRDDDHPPNVLEEQIAMTEPDATMVKIGQGIELGGSGEREAARRLFAELWEEIGATGDALHRCALAHSMADVQDDVHEELLWDLRALEAADLITDERAQRAGVATAVSGFYPSLHLNLGEAYRKLGDLGRARAHLERGLAAVGALGDDGYGKMIKGALGRLADRLSATSDTGPPATADRH